MAQASRHPPRVRNAHRLGAVLRVLRLRAGLRQQDLGHRAGVSESTVSRFERGQVDGTTVGTMVALFEAVGGWVEIRPSWHGAALDRLLDEGHARLTGRVIELLGSWGWQVEAEVSFSHSGDRGSIDAVAWHDTTRTVLVVEIKTELGSVEGLLRPLDVKVRLARGIVLARFGWRPLVVARAVVFPEDVTVRRSVARHAAVIRAALPQRSRAVRGWLQDPVGPMSGLWFLSDRHQATPMSDPAAVRRVRRVSGSVS